uniref:RING-type E3 ubiquitin transferase (cysteine targeting) n=1 Tax=Amphimedon queenslandica TaxID=400682 RepID=A0A1X7V1V3_AMPQE
MASAEKVIRISQLDALELDNELFGTMQDRFFHIFGFLPSSALIERLRPELKTLLTCLLYKFSLFQAGNCTFGQGFMSLQYTQKDNSHLTSRQKWLLLCLLLLPPWLSERFENVTNLFFPNFRADRVLNIAKGLFQLCNLLNFCLFLLYGQYPSLIERLLHLKMTPSRPQVLRELSYDYMNREIIWFGFSEFLFSVLPLLNLQSLKNSYNKILHSLVGDRETAVAPNVCVYCNGVPVLPQVSTCRHLFCYYCIAANVLADSNFPCPVCNERVTDFTHYNV